MGIAISRGKRGPSAIRGKQTVLFAPAALEDLGNMLPVAAALARLSAGGVEPAFLCLDAVYHAGVLEALSAAGVQYTVLHPRAASSDLPLLRPLWKKLAFSLLNRRMLFRLAQESDAFVCGAGGQPERILARGAMLAGKPAFQILPAVYSRYNLSKPKTRLLLALHRAAPSLGPLLPGAQLGAVALMRHVFTMGERAAETLRMSGVKASIHSMGLPRYADLFTPLPPVRDSVPPRRTLLFLPSAFRWHNVLGLHRLQMNSLRGLVEAARDMRDDYRIVVKLHPRDFPEDYEPLRKSGEVEVRKGELRGALEDAFLVVGMISSGLLEAVQAGRLAVSFMSGLPQEHRLRKTAEEYSFLPLLTATRDLREYLSRIRTPEVYASELQKQRAQLGTIMAPSTPEAAGAIAAVILGEITGSRRKRG